MVLAKEEARLLGHNYVGTEHILLGLVHEGEGIAAKVLESHRISLEAVRQQVEEIIGQGQAAPTGDIPFTPRAKKVLELSFREAAQLRHNHIGTEHILLGPIREGEGVAAQVLHRLGAPLNRTRRIVTDLLSSHDPTSVERTQVLRESQVACPSCAAPLDGVLVYHTLRAQPADEDGEPVPLRVFYCRNCGAMLDTSPAE